MNGLSIMLFKQSKIVCPFFIANATLYVTSESMTKLNENTALKDNVPSTIWTQVIDESHDDSIQSNQQCQSLAVLEGWQFSVFVAAESRCYFGKVNTENISLNTEIDTPMQININTPELLSYVSETFVIRKSHYYGSYSYGYYG